jgi:cell division protein ZapA
MTNQDPQSPTVKVTIYGQEYPIRGHGDEEYIRKVARYVDERMAQIEERTSISTPDRLAILAALNIADELFNLQKEKERILSEFEEKTRALSEHLTQGLSEA